MSLPQAPGFIGIQAKRVASLDKRAIGKFTDTNHLKSLHLMYPQMYDKKIISLYTQTAMMSNDFMQMLDKSTPFFVTGDQWQWDINVLYQYPQIVAVPDSTASNATPGIDGQEFQVVFDRKAFFKHQTITADRRYGQQFYIVRDPQPYNRGWLYTLQLSAHADVQTSYVDSTWLAVGTEYEVIDNLIGEFDQDMPGLPELGQKITLYETMAGAYGFRHTITKWADQMTLKDAQGRPLDIITYTTYKLNEMGKKVPLDVRWEPFVEAQMRKAMVSTRVKRAIWSKPGVHQTGSQQQEYKKNVEGLYWKIRNYGHRVTYNRGDFSLNLMRTVYGDLFYRRVPIERRKVKVYTNEAGMEVFSQAAKKDAMGSGFTFNVGDNDKFIQGKGQDLMLNYRFNKFYSIDTGEVTMVHLTELDEPQTSSEFGQNKKSTPVFLVFDISPDGDGTPANNIREVRQEGAPSMTWGYIDGRQSHLGHFASQNMSSASMFPGYDMWMEDRSDIFVEDLSRMVIIEEVPQY